MSDFKIGDVVKVKIESSAYPQMIIIRKTEQGILECVWYDSAEVDYKHHYFPPEALKKV